MESHARSLAKAISYRILGTLSTIGLVFFLTADWRLSAGAGLLDGLVKIALYFVHERLWNHIPFGRPKAPEYEI